MATPATLSQVPAQTPYIQYVAMSGQTVFPYPFEITQDSDLVVVANGVTLATDSGYTVSGVGASTGGNITFTSGRTAGDIITLYRDIPIERLTQFAQNGGFSSTAFNAEFNNVYLILQQLSQTLNAQCLQVPNTNNPAPTVSLTPGAYANKYLAFDSNGNPEPANLTSSGSLTRSMLGGLLFPQTTAESDAGVTPTNEWIPSHEAVGDVLLDRYGGDNGGVNTNDTAYANAALVAKQVGGATIRGGGGTYKFGSGITVDASYTSLVFDRAVFDFSAVTTGDAVLITGTVNPPYDQARAVFEGIKFLGNSGTGSVNGLHLNTSGSTAGASHLAARNCSVTAFGTGVLLDSNSYIVAFYSLDVYGCANNIMTASAPTNAGAAYNFHGGSSFNSAGYGLWNKNSTTDIYTYGMAFGGCGSASAGALVRADAGLVSIDGHLESQGGERALYVPSTAGTCFVSIKGQVTQDASSTAPLLDVEGPAFLNLLGGVVSLNSASTGAAVKMATGRYARWGTHIIVAGGQTAESISAGVNYVSVDLDGGTSKSNLSVEAPIAPTGGVIDGTATTVAVTTLSTWYTILTTGGSGLLVLTDRTAGGTAIYAVDSGAGSATSITSNITGIEVQYSGTNLQVGLTSGTMPHTLGWVLLQAKA